MICLSVLGNLSYEGAQKENSGGVRVGLKQKIGPDVNFPVDDSRAEGREDEQRLSWAAASSRLPDPSAAQPHIKPAGHPAGISQLL